MIRSLIIFLSSMILVSGCFAGTASKLSEQAKPQTPVEEFIVNSVTITVWANKADVWLAGVERSCLAGDTLCRQQVGVATSVGMALTDAVEALDAGNLLLATCQANADSTACSDLAFQTSRITSAMSIIQRRLLTLGVLGATTSIGGSL